MLKGYMKQFLVAFSLSIMFLFPSLLFGQSSTALVKGIVLGTESNEPVPGVIVAVEGQNKQVTTGMDGKFIIQGLKSGRYVIRLNSILISPKTLEITVEELGDTELEPIKVVELNATADVSMIGVVDLGALDDDAEIASQDINATMVLSNDVFLSKVAYQLSPARFSPRGYANIYEKKYINGVEFNDQNRGVFNYSSVGALNDMTRNGDATVFTAPSVFSFGSLGGDENINMRASSYAQGGKTSLSYTNRNYYLRGMFTYSTGLNDKGWAFTGSMGGRYSHEGAIDGTFYNNISLALSAEKQWQDGKHSLSLVTFVSPVQRGQQGSSLQEVYDLTGNNLYNPNWGYQDGKKRNAKVVTAFDPTAILSHIWKINEHMTLTTGVGAHYARYGNTALNWYNAPDPRPDYYRYLPSYFENDEAKRLYEDLWRSGNTAFTQINWDKLYEANANSVRNGDGAAIYMVEERRSDLFEVSFNSTLNAQLNRHFNLTAGIGTRYSQSRQFKTVNDLLGSEYVLDIDKFAEKDFSGDPDKIQNDLTRPNRRVYEDGVFGYNYHLNIYSANAWIVNQFTSRHWDYYYGAKLKYTTFQRDGLMKNGRYPDSSLGKGTRHNFVDYTFKGGLTYKFNGRHMLNANISYGSEAPLPNEAYVSPRVTDRTIDDIKSGRILAADFNYVFSMPQFAGRIGVFQTNFYDQMERNSYYDGIEGTFINHVLYGVDRIHRGLELGATYKLNDHWSFDAAGTISEYYYSNNPDGIKHSENGKIVEEEKVYMKDLYVGGLPQFAGTFGIRYFIDYWFLGANVNGFGRNYIDAAPLRRIASNYATVNPNDPEMMEAYRILTHQERFDAGCTLDLSIGKIFYLPGRQSINFNLSINNVLNNKDIRTGGYEQGRSDIKYPTRFGGKYYYMQGINCFLNASYRF